MAITANDIKSRFPEFCSQKDARIDALISEAGRRINDAAWAGKRDDGAAYLTAHLLVFTGDGSTHDAGPVTSEKTISTSATYGVGSGLQDDALGSTSFGRYYMSLRRTVFAARRL